MKSVYINSKVVLLLLLMGLLFCPSGLSAQNQSKKELEAQWIQVLKSNASVMEKDKACRELQVIGTTDSVPALSPLLSDPALSHMARYALEPMPYPEAGQALRDALKKTESLIKVGLLNSLAWRQEKAAVPDIVSQLNDKDSRVIEAAISALGRIGTPEAALSLVKLRLNPPSGMQAVVGQASLAMAEHWMKSGNLKEAAKIYDRLQSVENPNYIRQGALIGLMSAQPEKAVERILQAIRGNDFIVKPTAIAAIPSMKDPKAIRQFSEMLPKVSVETQILLIGALADCDPGIVLPTLIDALKNPNPKIQVTAVKALGRAGDVNSVAHLCRMLGESKEVMLKKEIVDSLGRMRGDRVNEEILASYKKADSDARASLIEVLVSRRIMESIDSLFLDAKGEPGRVREAALKALGNMAGATRLPEIMALVVQWQGEEERSDVESACIKIARRNPSEENRADAILDVFQQTKDLATKRSLLNILGGIANSKALGVVQGMAGEKNPELRDAYIVALAGWPNSKAIDLLLKEWKDTDVLRHKLLALRGSVRILRLNEIPAPATLNHYRYLMENSRNPDDKKLILSGLADAADAGALQLVEPNLANPEIRAEAELALLQIARRVLHSSPAEAKDALDKLRKEAQNPEVKTQAEELYNRKN